MNRIETIKNQIKEYESLKDKIFEKKNKCNICEDGFVKTGKKTEDWASLLFNPSSSKPELIDEIDLCECNYIVNDCGLKYTIDNLDEHISSKNNQLYLLLKDIPDEYKDININTVNSKILNFEYTKKIFMWIYGKTGTGKTHSIYSLKLKNINENRKPLVILKEYDLNYKDIDKYKDSFICIDDFGISENENRNIALLDLYFELIDNKREKHSKLIITSNLSIMEWLNKMKKYNYETALRISSRFSNMIEIIELTGEDKRKTKI
jgi:DNA replication protein DnaC